MKKNGTVTSFQNYAISYNQDHKILSEFIISTYDTLLKNFSYGNKIIIRTTSGADGKTIEIDSIFLNPDNYVSSIHFGDNKSPHYMICNYDGSDEITKIEYYEKGMSTEPTYFTWENGNMQTEKNGNSTYTFQYLNKKETLGGPHTFFNYLLFGAYIIKSNNLCASKDDEKWLYTFDNSGKITSIARVSDSIPDFIESLTYQYTCP